MRVLPILFNTDMVRAILEERKSVTRRVVKPQPQTSDCEHDMITFNDMLPQYYAGDYTCACRKYGFGVQHDGESIFRPPYLPGDILYVRETWYKDAGRYMYRANYSDGEKFYRNGKEVVIKWRPSIHMPKEVARIFLRVTGVRVERLQDISSQDIEREGIDLTGLQGIGCITRGEYIYAFQQLWYSTIKPADLPIYGWAANPWVWVIEFERVSKEAALKGGEDR